MPSEISAPARPVSNLKSGTWKFRIIWQTETKMAGERLNLSADAFEEMSADVPILNILHTQILFG